MPTPPQDAPSPARSDVEEKFALARGVIGALDRAMRTRRMYQPDHPIYIDNTDDLLARFIEFFDRFAYLRLDIRPAELRIEDRTVMQAPAREPELPFRLYKDGIREIRFHRGISREELLDFVGIMELTYEELEELGEDYVSLLWSKDFKSVDYVAIDEFELAEGESPVGLDPEQTKTARDVSRRVNDVVRLLSRPELGAETGAFSEQYRRGLDEAALAFPRVFLGDEDDPGVLGSIAPIQPEPEPPAEPPEGPEISEARLDAIFLRPVDEPLSAMRAEVENETIGGAIRRSLDILMKLHGDSAKSPVVEIGPLLRGVVEFYVRKGDFGSVGHLLAHLEQTGFLERWPGGRALWDLLVESVRRPELKKPLVGYLSRMYESDATGLHHYFKIVGPSMVRASCQIYAHVTNPRGRAALHDYLKEFGVADQPALRDLVTAAAPRHLGEIFDILQEVRPPGVALEVEAYLRDANPAVRRQALGLAARTEGPVRVRHLVAALADADAGVRLEALALIAGTRDAGFRLALQDWADRGDFLQRDAAEKEAAMHALARTGGATAFPYLQTVATRPPGVFQRAKAVEARRAAVLAIREVGTHEATEFLRAVAEGPDEQLASFAREALAARREASP